MIGVLQSRHVTSTTIIMKIVIGLDWIGERDIDDDIDDN